MSELVKKYSLKMLKKIGLELGNAIKTACDVGRKPGGVGNVDSFGVNEQELLHVGGEIHNTEMNLELGCSEPSLKPASHIETGLDASMDNVVRCKEHVNSMLPSPSTSSSSPSSDGTSSQTYSSTAAPSNTSALGDVRPLQDLVPLSSSNLLCSPTFASTDSLAAAQSSTPSPGTIPLLDAESCAGISLDITSLGDVRSLPELDPTTISSSVASISSSASTSQPAGQPPTPSGTIPLPPTACQKCNSEKRKSYSCAVCVKEFRDNGALRRHMEALHTPR